MRISRMLGVVAGVLALGVVAYQIGAKEVFAQIRGLGRVLPVVLAASGVRLLIQTRAWSIALRSEGIYVPQSRLIGVRLASQAAGYMASFGPAVSEPTKLALLRNSAGMSATAEATLLETGTYWFTSALMGLAGTCAASFLLTDSRAVWSAATVFGIALALLSMRSSLLSPLVRWAGPRAPQWLRSAEVVENRIRSFRERRPRAAAKVSALDGLAQLLTLVEVAGALWMMGLRVSVPQVLAIEAAGRMVKILGSWIPGRIGSDEGGSVASFVLLGYAPTAGLLLALARRGRDLLWCSAGILWVANLGWQPPATEAVTSEIALCAEER